MITGSPSPMDQPLLLPCGATLMNRIAKSANDQVRLCKRWVMGGLALSIIGEVQDAIHFAEMPGSLKLNDHSDQ